MPPAHFPGMLPPMRLDAPQGAETIPTASAPLHQLQDITWPSMYPLPGTSHPPLALPSNSGFNSFAPALYSANVVNYFPGFCMPFAPPGLIAPMEQLAPPMQDPNVPVVTPGSGPDFLSSEGVAQHDQSIQTTSQLAPQTQYGSPPIPEQQREFPAHPETAAVQDFLQVQDEFAISTDVASLQSFQQVYDDFSTQSGTACVQGQQRVQNEVQVAQQDFFVGGPPPEPEGDHKENGPAHEDSRTPLDQLAETRRHVCSGNPKSVCPGDGLFCIESLYNFVVNNQLALSPKAIARAFVTALSTAPSAGKSAVAPLPRTNSNDSLPSTHEPASWEATSSGTSARPSTSGSSSSSRNFYPSPLNNSDGTPELSTTFTVGSSTGKRSFGDFSEDPPYTEQKANCMNAGNTGHSCNCRHRDPHDSESPRKRRRPNVDGQFICLICTMFKEQCLPFARKDSLKRHILKLHVMFGMLLEPEHRDFNILNPRKTVENLDSLIEFCIGVQSQARMNGASFQGHKDLAQMYPDIVAKM